MVKRMNIGDAAAALSERIRTEGGGLTPEFSQPGTVEEVPAETQEEVVSEDAGASEDAELEAAPETGADGEDVERFELPSSVNELAELLGVDADAMYGLTLSMDLGDESEPMTLEQLKDAAKRPVRDEAETVRWESQKRALEAELTAQREALDARRQEADMLASVVLQGIDAKTAELQHAYNSLLSNVEYQSRDPQGYQVALMRHNAELQNLQTQKEQLFGQVQTMRQAMEQERSQHIERAQESGRKRLRELIPDWADDAGFEAGAGELRTYVMQERFGTTEQELADTLDPRILYWAEMARRYEALQQKAKEQPKPKPTAKLRPGAPAVKLPTGRRAELEAMDRLKQSGSIEDARAALTHRLRRG